MTKLFIDFDGVVFNSKKFKTALFSEIAKSGFSDQEVSDTYIAECLDGNYLPKDQLERLLKIRKFNMSLAEARIENILNQSEKYLFDDVAESLAKIKKLQYNTCLITLGHPDFQPKKVKITKIDRLFKNVYYTSRPKVDYLTDLIGKKEKFIIVDDRGDTLEEIAKKFPQALVIEMRREQDSHDPAERSSHFSGPKITNLKQLIEIL
jgi:phosphoglycolate phosphatase-like HAD superfamily hydrolase